MPYSERKRAIFVCIPKTATVSLLSALARRNVFGRNGRSDLSGRIPLEERERWRAANWEHISALGVIDELGRDTWDRCFTFTIVRNTYDRLVSFYEYSKAARLNPDSVQYGLPPPGDFATWLEEERPLGQMHYIADGDGTVLTDFVGRYENLKRDFLRVCIRLQVWPPRLTKRNTSVRSEYRAYFDQTLRKRVEELYGDEIERFGYRV